MSLRTAWLIALLKADRQYKLEALQNVLSIHPSPTWSTGVQVIREFDS
jgi:hypothetical protein